MGLPRKWTTKDGTKIWIKDMDVDHIVNCLKMLDRMSGLVESHIVYDISDGPAWSEWVDYSEYPIYKALEKELDKRQVTLKRELKYGELVIMES